MQLHIANSMKGYGKAWDNHDPGLCCRLGTVLHELLATMGLEQWVPSSSQHRAAKSVTHFPDSAQWHWTSS